MAKQTRKIRRAALSPRAPRPCGAPRFTTRMARAVAIWLGLTVFGLVIGMIGYAWSENMTAIDAYVNAAMILSGMGPLGELKIHGGKIFAGSYAIFSGLLIVIATGFVLSPVFHHVLHRIPSRAEGRRVMRTSPAIPHRADRCWCSRGQSRRR